MAFTPLPLIREGEAFKTDGGLFQDKRISSDPYPVYTSRMDRGLTWFIYGWVALAVLVNALAVVGMFVVAETAWDVIKAVQTTYSPFNIVNWMFEVVLLSPAIGAYWWREIRRERYEQVEATARTSPDGRRYYDGCQVKLPGGEPSRT